MNTISLKSSKNEIIEKSSVKEELHGLGIPRQQDILANSYTNNSN
jgi:hypothetical protein